MTDCSDVVAWKHIVSLKSHIKKRFIEQEIHWIQRANNLGF